MWREGVSQGKWEVLKAGWEVLREGLRHAAPSRSTDNARAIKRPQPAKTVCSVHRPCPDRPAGSSPVPRTPVPGTWDSEAPQLLLKSQPSSQGGFAWHPASSVQPLSSSHATTSSTSRLRCTCRHHRCRAGLCWPHSRSAVQALTQSSKFELPAFQYNQGPDRQLPCCLPCAIPGTLPSPLEQAQADPRPWHSRGSQTCTPGSRQTAQRPGSTKEEGRQCSSSWWL